MNGQIKMLWDNPQYSPAKQAFIGEGFQQKSNVSTFIATNLLGGNASMHLQNAKAPQWTEKSLQALYILCWIHHPVEKGTYMLDLAPVDTSELQKGMTKLPGRWSSHLSKTNAKSARKGWHFIKNSHELLIQLERGSGGGGTESLMLKNEGHMALSIAHMKSYLHSRGGNGGLVNNQALNAFATSDQNLIDARAAESFGPGYKVLMKNLGLNKQSNVRQMAKELLPKLSPNYRSAIITNMSNEKLAAEINVAILQYGMQVRQLAGNHPSVLIDLKIISDNLRKPEIANTKIEQVYNEVRVTHNDLDQSYRNFLL